MSRRIAEPLLDAQTILSDAMQPHAADVVNVCTKWLRGAVILSDVDRNPALRYCLKRQDNRLQRKWPKGHAEGNTAARNTESAAICRHIPMLDTEDEWRDVDGGITGSVHGSDLSDDEACVDPAKGKGI
jgi:hypothetical protein